MLYMSSPEHAGGELGPFVALVGFAGRRGVGGLLRPGGRHDNDPVVVGHDRVARIHQRARADDRNVDRAKRRLDRALGAHAFAPDRKAHLGQRLHVAHAGVDDEALGAARHEAGREEIAEVAVGAVGRDRRDDDVARFDLFADDMHHPVVAGMKQNRHRRSGDQSAGVNRPHIRLHQPHPPHRLMHGRDAVSLERFDGGAFGALDFASDDAEFSHRSLLPASRTQRLVSMGEARCASSS